MQFILLCQTRPHNTNTSILRSWERRGGFSKDRGIARILTTSILKPKPEKHPMTRRVVRIGSRIACQQPQKLRLYPCKSTLRKPRSRRLTALRYPAITRLYYGFFFWRPILKSRRQTSAWIMGFSRIKINIERLTNVVSIFTRHCDLRPASLLDSAFANQSSEVFQPACNSALV